MPEEIDPPFDDGGPFPDGGPLPDDGPLPDFGSLKRGRFTYFPVVPGRLEFAIEVRQAILRERPQVIALELPSTLQPAWTSAVARLPEMSLIFYPDETAGDDQAVYVPIRISLRYRNSSSRLRAGPRKSCLQAVLTLTWLMPWPGWPMTGWRRFSVRPTGRSASRHWLT